MMEGPDKRFFNFFLAKINSNDAKLSRNYIIGVLNKDIVPRSNITPEEIKPMKDL